MKDEYDFLLREVNIKKNALIEFIQDYSIKEFHVISTNLS